MKLIWWESTAQYILDAETEEESKILALLAPFLQPSLHPTVPPEQRQMLMLAFPAKIYRRPANELSR